MKTLLRKKWFRRVCQTLLALLSLLVLAYVFIDWRGARMKRDVIAEMRAAGRPTSIAETLRPLPRDEDNFAMIPILAQAREEWWNDKSRGFRKSPDQARVRLEEMTFRSGKKAFARDGHPDFSIWKKNLKLTGNDAECLDAYDHRFGEILAELRSGLTRPQTASPLFTRLAASSATDLAGMTSGYVMGLADVAESLGFRAELALAAGRPEVAHESLSMAIRLSELIGSEGTLIGQLLQGRVIRRLQPTLARALQSGGWDKAKIFSIKNELAAVNAPDGFRRALDVENFASFGIFEEMKKHPESIAWGRPLSVPEWQYDIFTRISAKLPAGWFLENAALRARQGLQLRDELGEEGNLGSWFRACERAGERGQFTSSWEFWRHPMKNDVIANAIKNACRNQTMIQQAMLACDLETYRLDHGRYPQRLQETGSPSITDSMTGESFIYRIADSRYQLYSIGSDGKDDGGDRSKQNTYDKQDWVW